MTSWFKRFGAAAALVALLALTATGCREARASGALSFPVAINVRTDRVLSAGDSVIAGIGNQGAGQGLLAPVFWRIAARQAALRGAPSGVGFAVTPDQIYWRQDGISGTTNIDLATAVSTRVLAYSPTVFFFMGSSNEWAVSQATWEAAANTLTNAVKGQAICATVAGGCKVIVISNLFSQGEQWTTAGGWTGNTRDAAVAALNVIIKNWADTRGDVYYMNLRGDSIADVDTYLRLVSQTNTPEPGAAGYPTAAGIADASGLHAIIPAGQKKFEPMISARLAVTY